MHRTICRAIRSIRKATPHEKSPTITGEEIHQQKSNEEFTPPPRHTWTEALGWTTGIVLSYEFIHRRRALLNDSLLSASPGCVDSRNNRCPFRLTSSAWSQPIISTVNHVFTTRSSVVQPSVRKSIDVTPFILDELRDEKLEDEHSPRGNTELDDDFIKFDDKLTRIDHVKRSCPKDSVVSQTAEKLSADIFSALGAFQFLTKSNPESGIELLEKGAELGSRRSLYNLGVTYDRMNEKEIALSYYERAADLGHPLASYNLAVFKLKDGKLGEGLSLIDFAAENGVEEARVLRGELVG